MLRVAPLRGRGGLRAGFSAEPSSRFARPSHGEGEGNQLARQQLRSCTAFFGERRLVALLCLSGLEAQPTESSGPPPSRTGRGHKKTDVVTDLNLRHHAGQVNTR
ncbi:hypothetical protein RB2297 [Rhodopirellula baltica SH 1]|uniref:Uncharacterized protein n=1 Tax=Rhodopirellula baltica (strain DSM 10527 / NCIMB 13988 / SH1) TaxID=243090 RepID=Q7UW33_RHOBA|nr:hypothetical protein RB2297 [Rhodopirellula baltica SH 1]